MNKKKYCGYWWANWSSTWFLCLHGMCTVIGFVKNVTLRREENGYKRMCLGRLCIYFLYWWWRSATVLLLTILVHSRRIVDDHPADKLSICYRTHTFTRITISTKTAPSHSKPVVFASPPRYIFSFETILILSSYIFPCLRSRFFSWLC